MHPDLPVKTLADIEAYARSNPGRLTFGSQGFGVGPHLLIEMFKLDTGTNIIHVPYRGTAPMLSALVSGEIQMAIDPTTTILPLIQAGKVRAIAVTTPTRSPELPEDSHNDRSWLPENHFDLLARSRCARRHPACDRSKVE